MGEPDFSFEGVNENEAYSIEDGGTVIDTIRRCVATGVLNDVNFVVSDESGNDYFLECVGCTTLNRFGKDRLYVAVMNLDEESNSWYTYYVARRGDGTYFLVHESDEGMFNAFLQKMGRTGADPETPSEVSKKKKSGNGWIIAFKIILFPFWLLWKFIKVLLSFFNMAAGDSPAVKAFKRGYNGDSTPMKEYTFINSMGCEQTVYSSNGREFYGADGSFVGTSNDGGKTIIEE